MKLNKQIANLIYELEHIIGRSCYNPNSYNGYTGEEGCSFRYPVCIYNPEDDCLEKTWSKVDNIPAKYVNTMKYMFGSNHLFIGAALINILTTLENRYELDFNELEKQYQKSIKKSK